jgi:PIN like domain
MRVLVDENTAVQVMEPLKHLLPRHEVHHVAEIGWKGKKDEPLLRDAGRAAYHALLTLDRQQLRDPDECKAIKASGLHHIRYEQRRQGLAGLALAIGAVIAAMPAVMAELEAAEGQRLVRIVSLDPNAKRFEITDPA